MFLHLRKEYLNSLYFNITKTPINTLFFFITRQFIKLRRTTKGTPVLPTSFQDRGRQIIFIT